MFFNFILLFLSFAVQNLLHMCECAFTNIYLEPRDVIASFLFMMQTIILFSFGVIFVIMHLSKFSFKRLHVFGLILLIVFRHHLTIKYLFFICIGMIDRDNAPDKNYTKIQLFCSLNVAIN